MRRLTRARIESAFASALTALTIVTTIWPTWIESLVEVSPDGGSGEAEWGLVVTLAILAVLLAGLARRDFRLHRSGGPVTSEG
jgi:hypothetical protein